jgi:hypothetical protein
MAAETLAQGLEAETKAFSLVHAEGWLIYFFVALALVLMIWAWRSYGPGPRQPWKVIAKTCRILAILAAIVLITGPAWRISREVVVPGRLGVVVDCSGSMAKADGPKDTPRIQSATTVRLAVESYAAKRALEVQWFAAGGQARRLDGPIPLATGVSTQLGSELDEIAASAGLDMVMVLSDFRSTGGTDLEVVAKRWQNRRLRCQTLAVGGDSVEPELSIEEVIGPAQMAIEERQPFQVRLNGRNLGKDPIKLRLSEVGKDNVETVLEETDLPAGDVTDPVTRRLLEGSLTAVLRSEGDHRLRFSAQQGELKQSAERTVTVLQRKLRILILAWDPCWEFRYLKNALTRDPTVTAVHIYTCEGRWRAWGSTTPEAMPFTPELLKDYDLIVLGDIPASSLNEERLALLERVVRSHGVGLVWWAGKYGHLASFRTTSLGRLLPVELPDAETIAKGFASNRPFQVERTPLAKRLGLLEPGPIDWRNLPPLLGACAIAPDRVKKQAEIVMTDPEGKAVVAMARSGDGASLFIGIDETWRWRKNAGDLYLHRFWTQLLRYVSSGRGLGDKRWRIDAAPTTASPGETVRLGLVPIAPLSGEPPSTITLQLKSSGNQSLLVQLSHPQGEPGYRTIINAPAVGVWTIAGVESDQNNDLVKPQSILAGELTVVRPRAELIDPRVDLEAAKLLAASSGGESWHIISGKDGSLAKNLNHPDQTISLEKLLERLPDLASRQESVRTEPLWDRWWTLVALVTILAIEWSIRRLNRLP